MAATKRPRRMPPLELVREILSRLPLNEPACLRRASLACKDWERIISDPAFRRRLLKLHGTPPVLGFLHNLDDEAVPRFVSTRPNPFALDAPDCHSWRALGCRHGRALFLSKGQDTRKELLLWEPMTGAKQRVRVPAGFDTDYGAEKIPLTAAVFCAADGCAHHHGCHGGPFRLVFVSSVHQVNAAAYVTSACVYSSEAGTWGVPTSMQGVFSMKFTCHSSVLVRGSQLYFMSDNVRILEYDLAKHSLTVLDPPDNPGYLRRFNILLADDGGLGSLGVCQYVLPMLNFWTKAASDGTDAQWVPTRAINLGNVLPADDILNPDGRVQVLGFAEGANVMFFNTSAGIFTVELQSGKATKFYDKRGIFCDLIPFVSFYTPVPRIEHQDPLSSGSSEEAGGEEEKIADQAQQLLDKGSSAIKEGGLDNTLERVSHDLVIRVPRDGEVAPDCASMEGKNGRALPSDAQQVNDPMGEVPNSELNEELVKATSTVSRDYAGNSKTSGSNVEDGAPTSEKGDSEEASSDDAGNSKTSGSNVDGAALTSEKGDSEEVLLS